MKIFLQDFFFKRYYVVELLSISYQFKSTFCSSLERTISSKHTSLYCKCIYI